jgi:hypothetical protein
MADFQTIALPDGTQLQFPSGMSDADIASAIESNFPELSARPQAKDRSFGETLYENVVGSGEIDTTGERISSLVKGAGAGIVRGAAGVLGLPSMAMSGMDALAAKLGILRPDYAEVDPFGTALKQATSTEGIRGAVSDLTGGQTEYVDPTTLGKYVGTTSEFVGGGGFNVPAIAGGLLSEASGQAFEGTSFEPAARIVGGIVGGVGGGIGKGLLAPKKASVSIDQLRNVKNEAYKIVDDAKVVAPAQFIDDLAVRARAAVDDLETFDPDFDLGTVSALKIIEGKAGQDLKLGQLDKIRQGLWKKYTKTGEMGIKNIIDELDATIDNVMGTNPALKQARLANMRYKKAELLDDAFNKADLQTSGSGSGGNIQNKFRQAVTRILGSKDARFFSKEEVSAMENFVRGSFDENTMRLIGKLSPSGNGLMAALNLGAVVTNPAMIGVTLAGVGAKAVADRRAIQGAGDLITMLGTGTAPAARATMPQNMAKLIGGLSVQ